MTVARDQSRRLRGIDLFAGVPDEELDRLAARLRTRRYRAGEQIRRPEAGEDIAYVVLRGAVRLFHRGPDGREVTAAELGRGCFFGVARLFGTEVTDGPWAEATTDAVLCLARGADFRDLLHRHPVATLHATRLIAARLLEVEGQLERMSAGRARARLAGVLVGLASPTGEPPPERSWVGAAPTHAALAREMGASRETVTRLLAGLEADGLIDRRGRRVAVPDLARLAAEAGL
jgi:CRP-like cAMP-binding protein